MKAVVLALLAIGLAGCEALVNEFDTLSENAPAQEVNTSHVDTAQPEAEPREEPPEEAEPMVSTPAPLPPRPRKKPTVTGVGFDKLTGLTPRQSERLLGPPDHRSDDPPATVWTYEIGTCRLEMFFYFDLESQQQRSLAYDIYTGGEAQGAEALCLVQFVQRGERQDPSEELLNGMSSQPPPWQREWLMPNAQSIMNAGEAHENGEDTESE